jgi:hypothetical protein
VTRKKDKTEEEKKMRREIKRRRKRSWEHNEKQNGSENWR